MPLTIDGLQNVASVAMGTISLSAGSNNIGRVFIEGGTNPNYAQVENQSLIVSTEAPPGAGSSVATSGSEAVGNVAGTSYVIRPGIAAGQQRKFCTITNPETSNPLNVLWIGATNPMVAGTGIPVYPGETYEDTESQDAWYGIFAVTGLNVPWHEVIIP